MRSQRGLAAAAIILIIILGAVALMLGRGVFQPSADLGRREATSLAMTKISKALVDFAALNRRLPCPARGDVDTGEADPSTAAETCTAAGGVVPWKALALRRDDALDGWGRKISYRVFSGTTGFTRDNGLDMLNCNLSLGEEPERDDLDANSFCRPASDSLYLPPVQPNTPTQFINARGNMLEVNDLGTNSPKNAFVLISHGATGRGAYAAENGARASLPNVAGKEFTNTQSGTNFWILPNSANTVSSDDSTHFDDIVSYQSFAVLMQGVKLTGRDWGRSSATTFTSARLSEAGGDTAQFNLGQHSLNLGTYTVTAWADNLLTVRNVSFDRNAATGIGSIGTGSNTETAATVNFATDEELQFQFTTQGRYLGVTLHRFGDTSGELERVRFRFTVGGVSVNITKTSCRYDSNDGVVNFTLNPGGDFDEVFIEPRSTQWGSFDTTLIVGAIATCPSTNSSCAAPGAVAANDCP